MPRFEIVKGLKRSGLKLPVRQTKYSAGYDFEAAETVTIPPIWRSLMKLTIKPMLVPTGIKADMDKDECLLLFNRSGNPLKRLLLLANGVGLVDSDYYGNNANDGNIMFQFWNFGLTEVTIEKGERIGQGVFVKYLLTDDDTESETTRNGGFGHTGE